MSSRTADCQLTGQAQEDLDAEAARLVDAALNGDAKALRELMESGAGDENGQPEPDTKPRLALSIDKRDGESDGLTVGRALLRPTVQGAVTSYRLLHTQNMMRDALDLNELVNALGEQVKAVNDKDLDRGEAMLITQAHTLDEIYNYLVRKAVGAEYLSQLDAYMKLALRAQSQCRSTLEAISAIQNPPIAGYVKQANIAQNQQVNNSPRARENGNPPNKLLESKNHETDQWMDLGAPAEAARADTAVETVGAVDRTADP